MHMKTMIWTTAGLLALVIAIPSCKEDDLKEEEIPVTEVNITPSTGGVVEGTTLQLEVEVLPENASDKEVTWMSREPEIATVDENGLVTGLSAGDATIVAMAGGVNGFAKITVTPAPIRVESITLNQTELPMFVGATYTLTAEVKPDNATNKTVTWASDKPETVSVDDKGVVTAIQEGQATITATADEKTASCIITVSVPAFSNLDVPFLSECSGNTVVVTAAGFMTGDKVRLEAVAGTEYTAEVNVTDITAESASFEFPAEADRTRSYKITVMRDGQAAAESYLHPDGNFATLPYQLGYYMTASGEVVPDDPSMRGNRRGYMSGKIVDYNTETREFRVWKGDLALSPLNIPDGKFDMEYASDVTSLNCMKGIFDFSSVTYVYVPNSCLVELDMSMFPNATMLHAWGDPGSGLNKIASVYFEGNNALQQIQLERQSLTGTLDLTGLPALYSVSAQDNQLTGVNFGEVDNVTCCPVYYCNFENNQIREFSIENCGQIRQLMLKGNPIERLTLLNNSKAPGSMQWMYVFKNQEDFTLSWASEAEAQGERVFNVEQYWWRVYSQSNSDENTANGRTPYDDWVNNGPIVQALKDGVKIICWTYHGEDGSDAHPINGHEHEGGSEPCTY